MVLAPWHAPHAQALARGARSYTDPATGHLVFTELALLDRGTCCGAGCRHCPYGHAQVPAATATRGNGPRLLHAHRGPRPGADITVIAWSGGKDAWLAWQAHGDPHAVWLTTYDPTTQTLPVQEVAVATVRAQADRASVPLVLSPVGPHRPVGRAQVDALDVLARRWRVRAVVFGDLWLPGIPEARQATLGPWLDAHQATLALPLWGRPAADLLDHLFTRGPRVRIRASRVPQLRAGDPFTRAVADALPPTVDPMGEEGAFHTEVCPDDLRPLGHPAAPPRP